MERDVTSASFCLMTFRKKNNCILLVYYLAYSNMQQTLAWLRGIKKLPTKSDMTFRLMLMLGPSSESSFLRKTMKGISTPTKLMTSLSAVRASWTTTPKSSWTNRETTLGSRDLKVSRDRKVDSGNINGIYRQSSVKALFKTSSK